MIFSLDTLGITYSLDVYSIVGEQERNHWSITPLPDTPINLDGREIYEYTVAEMSDGILKCKKKDLRLGTETQLKLLSKGEVYRKYVVVTQVSSLSETNISKHPKCGEVQRPVLNVTTSSKNETFIVDNLSEHIHTDKESVKFLLSYTLENGSRTQ